MKGKDEGLAEVVLVLEQEVSERIVGRARALGFDAVAIVRAQRLVRGSAYVEWLSEGRHGEMGFMENYQDLRVDPQVLEPGTKSVVVVLKNYHRGPDRIGDGLRVARYAHGDDYHDVLRARLRELGAFIYAETGSEVGTRSAVDTAPLLERDLAAMAGLGWVGKNAMLIHPELGSFTFIAEVLVGVELAATDVPVVERCGSCSRCIDGCPTGAIVSPYIIDARRCISYLTIELRGPIPRELRRLMGDFLYGCDLCQSVCPWNRKAPSTDDPAFVARATYEGLSAVDLLEMSDAAYAETFRRSAIKRAKRRGLLRNAAVVLGNTAQIGDGRVVACLQARLVAEHEPLVRGHVAWALGEIVRRAGFLTESRSNNLVENLAAAGEVVEVLQTALAAEQDAYVQEEIRAALEGNG